MSISELPLSRLVTLLGVYCPRMIGAATITLTLGACTIQPVGLDHEEQPSTPEATLAAQELPDSVQWDENGVLEFTTDGGMEIRLVRDGPWDRPASVDVWENGVKVGVIDLIGASGPVEEYRWNEPLLDWADSDDSGFLLATSAGMPGGGGGGPCQPEDPGCEQPEAMDFFMMSGGDCDAERFEFEAHAGAALSGAFITGGLAFLQLATKAPLTNITRRAASATASAAVLSIRSARELIECIRQT